MSSNDPTKNDPQKKQNKSTPAAEHGAESLVHGAEHMVRGAELFSNAESHLGAAAEHAPPSGGRTAEQSPSDPKLTKAAEDFAENAEIYHSNAKIHAGGEDSSDKIASSSGEMLHAAEFIMAEAEPLSSSAEKMMLDGAELVVAGAEVLSPAATGISSAEGAEMMAEGGSEMALGAKALNGNFSAEIKRLTHGAELLNNGAELTHGAESIGEKSFNNGAFKFLSSAQQIIPAYSSAGTVSDSGTYYNLAGVFLQGAEDILNGAEELSPIPKGGLPDLATAEIRIATAEDQLLSNVNKSFPLQLEGAEMIQKGSTKLINAIKGGEDLIDAAESFYKGVTTYVNLNAEAVEEFDLGSAEIKASAEEFTTNISDAESKLFTGAEDIKVSAAQFRYLGAENGAEVGAEDFVVGGSNDLAERYVGNPEDLMPAAESVLDSAEILAKGAENPLTKSGSAEMVHGAEKLIAASEMINSAEEGSIALNAAAAEVMTGAEEYIKGSAESAVA